jgi:uncharacterized membrane protein
VDEQEDDLIETKPDQKGQPGGNAGMPDMSPIDLTPPLGDNEGDEERNAKVGGDNHGGIQQDVAAGEGINPLRDGLIHLYRRFLCLNGSLEECMNERRVHQIFEISVLLKGAHALIECIGGLVLAFVSTSTITGLVNALTQEELIEDPNDFVATHLLTVAQNFTVSTQRFYAFYLLSHGVIKVFLVVGLLRNKLWAYPVSLVVLGLFTVYQLYRFSYTHGVGLIVLTVFDVIVMGLIWHEYQLARRHLTSR